MRTGLKRNEMNNHKKVIVLVIITTSSTFIVTILYFIYYASIYRKGCDLSIYQQSIVVISSVWMLYYC